MRILWLKTELLHPIDKGGKIRTYQMLKELMRNHHITYVCLDDGSSDADARAASTEYCHELITVPHKVRTKFSPAFYAELAANLFSPHPYFIVKYASAPMARRIKSLLDENRFDVLVCDFLNPGVNLPRKLHCPSVLFQHNVEADIWKRHFETQSNVAKRIYLYSQWQKTVRYEAAACRRFDKVIAVSTTDAATLERSYGISGVADIPTGVDTEYFRPRGGETRDPLNLVFTGSMDWLPNDDGIKYFVEQIFPAVRAQVPGVNLTVVGRSPYPWLEELARRDPAVRVTGRVPDVRAYMERASAFIVPLRVGGGTRLKIYEAMAMELPVISTTIGAEGLPVNDGEHLLIADDATAFANGVVRLITQPEDARRIAMCAAETVRREFGWQAVTARFAEICSAAAEHRGAAPRDLPHGEAALSTAGRTK